MELNKKDFGFIKTEKDWRKFLKSERIYDYTKIPVKRAKITGWPKLAFIFIRIYIVIMLILILLGFLHLI